MKSYFSKLLRLNTPRNTSKRQWRTSKTLLSKRYNISCFNLCASAIARQCDRHAYREASGRGSPSRGADRVQAVHELRPSELRAQGTPDAQRAPAASRAKIKS